MTKFEVSDVYIVYISYIESEVKVLVTQLCLTLCDPMDCNLLGSSVHEIFQARILKWIATEIKREEMIFSPFSLCLNSSPVSLHVDPVVL